jgi:putative ABC transport system ATP-binding protein
VKALDGVTLEARRGEVVAVVGPSGSGKTTLLNLIAGLDDPDEGSVHVVGQAMASLSDRKRAELRRTHLGFVFQRFGLMPTLSAAENVGLALRTLGVPASEREQRAREALASVGLADRARHRPGELSGGERQRVAIARALVHGPAAILADEPTGELDSANGAAILELLGNAAAGGTAVLIASHDERVRETAGKVTYLHRGVPVPGPQDGS